MAKRGRRPNPDKNYFKEEQEAAVIEYINSQSQETRSRIYDRILAPAFKKMVESIIRRYKLYIPDEEFDETYCDTLTFLVTNMDKYDPDKGKKAYSYYGTICKNYLITRIEKYGKDVQTNLSIDRNPVNIYDNIKYSNYNEPNKTIAKESIRLLLKRIDAMLANPEEYKLKEMEVKTGEALKVLFENWDYVLSTDGSVKLNKNAILLFLREKTNLETKAIRDNMKKYKKIFYEIKALLVN